MFVGPSVRPRNLLLQSLLVILNKSHGVESFTNTRAIQLLRERLHADLSRFVETIESDQCLGQVSGPDSRVRIQPQCLTRRHYCFLKLPGDRVEVAQIARSARYPRIAAHVRLLTLDRFLQFT